MTLRDLDGMSLMSTSMTDVGYAGLQSVDYTENLLMCQWLNLWLLKNGKVMQPATEMRPTVGILSCATFGGVLQAEFTILGYRIIEFIPKANCTFSHHRVAERLDRRSNHKQPVYTTAYSTKLPSSIKLVNWKRPESEV